MKILKVTKENEQYYSLDFIRGYNLGATQQAEIMPERKNGKWLSDNITGGGFWVCSCCKFPSEAFAADVLYKFCPNCGADMRGESDGRLFRKREKSIGVNV